MTSASLGAGTSPAEVTNISALGFWVLVNGRELFLPFEEFPWFRDAPVSAILELEQPRHEHLHWPALDVDLHLESIEHPERFPLRANFGQDQPESPNPPMQRTGDEAARR